MATPNIQSAVVAASGEYITLTYDRAVTLGGNHSHDDFSVHMSIRGNVIIKDVLIVILEPELRLRLVDLIEGGEIISLDYTQPGDGVEDDVVGDDASSFEGLSVVNNSQVAQGGHTGLGSYMKHKLAGGDLC